MASTYSPNLGIELIGTGDQAGQWGNTTNTNLGTLIEQAISGYATFALTAGVDNTLTIPDGTSSTGRNMYIELTGGGGASTNVIVPNKQKIYFFYNNTSSPAGAVTVKVSGYSGISVAAGLKTVLVCNGTNVVSYAVEPSQWTTTGSDIYYTLGNVGIGTSTPTEKLTVIGNASITGNVVYTGTLTGGTGVVTIGTNQIVKDASGNVGIGTATPAYKLDVNGTVNIGGAITASTAIIAVGTNQIYKDASGNVGIGTATPTEKLNVVGNIKATGSLTCSTIDAGTF